jgi:hypothetical protein
MLTREGDEYETKRFCHTCKGHTVSQLLVNGDRPGREAVVSRVKATSLCP